MDPFSEDLAELPLFAEASRSELATIRRHLTLLPVAAGRVLVREGARGDQFMIMAEGEATVSQNGRTIATIERGDLVGEMALLGDDNGGQRNATVTVRTNAVVYAGTRADFHQILDAAPSVAVKVRQTAASRRAVDAA